MNKAKKNNKQSANHNKKEAGTKSKQALNKSVERRKKGGLNLTTESKGGLVFEDRNVKDKINIEKPTKHDREEKKSSSVSNRTNKATKTKDYNNNTNKLNADDSEDEGKEKGGDFLYKAMYKTNIDSNKGYSNENASTHDYQKTQKDKDISKSKEKPISQPAGTQFAISMERTDDIHYDIGDKKIHSNIKKSYQYDYKANNDRKDSEDSSQKKYSETQSKKPNYNSGSNYERPSNSTYSSKTPDNFINERTIDLFVIDTDDGEEPLISSKYKKRIDRTRNKIKEIKIEKYDSKTPIRDEKLTGFVLIRKSKGKRIYDVEFEDNFDKINEILKNKKVMIKNEIIQFVTLTKLSNYDRDIKNYTDKISRLQNDLNKKDYSKPRDNDNKSNEYEKQISELKSKNQELNKIIFKQQDELDENIREFKQVKLAYDQLKDSIEREKMEREKMEKEKEREKEQLREQQIKEEPSKIKKKAAQMQLDEDHDQKAIKEMKLRIKKYKDVLKKPDENNKIPFTYRQDEPSFKGTQSPTKKRHKATIENAQNKDNQSKGQEPSQNPDEDEDEEIGEYVLGDEDAKDPKKRKMKNAVNRFRKKYHEVIKEEKKLQKEKEKEEREREENEERELEDENYQEEKEREEREREEKERREREEKERKEREEFERRERERKEKEERERKEREERERKERERKERERKEREERERKERERKERERKEREEKERKEKERKEKEKKDIKPSMGGARAGGGKMGVNFSKMLAEKLKMAPPGGMKKGAGAPKVDSKPPIMDKNVDMVKLLEEQPFQGRKDKKKPTRKVFVIEDDNED